MVARLLDLWQYCPLLLSFNKYRVANDILDFSFQCLPFTTWRMKLNLNFCYRIVKLCPFLRLNIPIQPWNCIPQIWPPGIVLMQRGDMENIWKLEIEHKVGTGRRCGGPKTTDRGPFRICAVERLSVSCDASPIPKHNQHIFKKGNWFVISLLARFSAELSIYYLELYVCIIPLSIVWNYFHLDPIEYKLWR